MEDELMEFDMPQGKDSIIKVIGVGGGGGNALNHMFERGITGVDFVICNTDNQALKQSPVPNKIQLGSNLTNGLGAGNKPERGRQAAIESLDDIAEILSHNTQMVFVTAGMGGGTGTGAAPIIAKEAKDNDILTVGIVTLPFRVEGPKRMKQAMEGLNEMREVVDSLIVIDNEKLREIYGNLPASQAFGHANDVLADAAKGIAEIITVHGLVNVDFADVKSVMSNSGVAIMGSAMASGDNRAYDAVTEALRSPLLSNHDIKGASNILINIASSPEHEVTLDEIGIINDHAQAASDNNADIIWGDTYDESLGESVSVTIIATGFSDSLLQDLPMPTVVSKPTPNVDQPVDEQPTADKNEPIDFNFDDAVESSMTDEMEITSEAEMETNPVIFIEQNVAETETQGQLELFTIDQIPQVEIPVAERPAKPLDYDTEEKLKNLENVPAYMRAGIKIDSQVNNENYQPEDESQLSRTTISTDKDGNIKLRQNNSFLFDNVD